MRAAVAGRDALAGAGWECTDSEPGSLSGPQALAGAARLWRPASVPGTVAGALRDAEEWRWGEEDEELLDGRDWWYRCRFVRPGEGPWVLSLDGLATVADVWLDGELLLHSENMWVAHRIAVAALEEENELVLRFSALSPLLAQRRSRPRWHSRLVRSQNLRWYRTTLLGRIPGWSRWAAPVGPWNPILLEDAGSGGLLEHRLEARCDGPGGVVRIRASVTGPARGQAASAAKLRVGEHAVELTMASEGTTATAAGELRLASIERWWPHTHGSQPRYRVSLEMGEVSFDLGSVGFRSVDLDRSGGGFRLVVNGEPIFCRGACWVSPDVVSFNPPLADLRASLERMRDAGMNMVRVGGYAAYEGSAFWEACDELGLLVWQDCMLASYDPPADAAFTGDVEAEVRQRLGDLGGRPALAIVCGSSETQQQAGMYGLPAQEWTSPLLEELIPAVVADVLPGVPYVASSPSGSALPFHPDTGVSHYFGVGAYLRPAADARLACVRFAAECLAFATPPEAETMEELFGGATAVAHGSWKLAVPRDTGASWDFEDVRDHYVRELYGIDPLVVRYAEPDRALDLGRAAVAELMAGVMTEWRRAASSCAGALVLSWQDLWPGAGWGLLDARGRPKAPWFALRRVLAPVAVLIADEGLSGIRVHLYNDRPTPFSGRLSLQVFDLGGRGVEQDERPVEVPAHGELVLAAEVLLGGFRDLNWAYRFGPPSYDVVAATLTGPGGDRVSDAVHPLLGLTRVRQADVGLEAHAERAADGHWAVSVSTRDFAQSVAVDVPGFRPDDSWFHLQPGGSRTVILTRSTAEGAPDGRVRALNSTASTRIRA